MRCKAIIAAVVTGFPSRDLVFYGVTGTDGKTTTNEMLYHIMKQAGLKVGIISTVSIDVGEERIMNETKLTTLTHLHFQKLLQKAHKNGLTHMVIEPSSHALYQSRVWPVRFSGVGITNLTREHLDFHWTMEHYLNTKLSLFRSYAASNSLGLIPHNFPRKESVLKENGLGEIKTFGKSCDADVYVQNMIESPHLGFTLWLNGESAKISTKIVGSFNTDNMMIAGALAANAGVSLDHIQSGLESFSGVPGRQEMVVSTDGVTAMIDFALTPDGLSTLYSAVRRMGFKKQIAIFGATGNRDHGKRPTMAKIATELCDYVILTEDENYHEDGMSIIHQLESGIDQEAYADGYEIVQDRKKAIERGYKLAQPGDILIVTGMGNFTSRAMNQGKIDWNEREVIEDIMGL